MRSRTFREGSVGLLILAGIGVFGLIFLWINRITAAGSSYQVIIEFADAAGMQKGAPVRYRGVKVGNIASIQPKANMVEVEVEISKTNLLMPRDLRVEANQSGLISESIIDITPKEAIPPGVDVANPLSPKCDPTLIVCNGSRLKGQIGISVDELIRSSTRLTNLYTQPEVYANINRTLISTSKAAEQVAKLTTDVASLSKTTQQELRNFSTTADSLARSANQVSVSTSQTANKFGNTAEQLNVTAKDFSNTAQQFGSTANRANRLIGNLDTLVTSNRSSLVEALNNITETSNELRVAVGGLSPTINKFTQGELLQNLETLSANAAQASTNLRDITKQLNDPTNVMVLQQTLDSARVTFQNTQKITSDLDDLTGDPKFRQNLRELVNGLSGLVTSTDEMQKQVELATTLETVKTSINQQKPAVPNPPTNKVVLFNTKSAAPSSNNDNQPQLTQEKLLQKLREHQRGR